jgi:hypothetical protein
VSEPSAAPTKNRCVGRGPGSTEPALTPPSDSRAVHAARNVDLRRPKIRGTERISVDAEYLKRLLPTVKHIATDVYGIVWSSNRALCTLHDDHRPSLVYDPKRNRVFCPARNCFGEKGADAFEFLFGKTNNVTLARRLTSWLHATRHIY